MIDNKFLYCLGFVFLIITLSACGSNNVAPSNLEAPFGDQVITQEDIVHINTMLKINESGVLELKDDAELTSIQLDFVENTLPGMNWLVSQGNWKYDVENVGNILPTQQFFAQLLEQDINVSEISTQRIWCGKVVSSVSWTEGDDMNHPYVASNTPTVCGRTNSGNLNGAWVDSYNATPSHSSWDKVLNTNQYYSMYNQFICHYVNPITTFKGQWNLEPSRPNVGLRRTYTNRCNP